MPYISTSSPERAVTSVNVPSPLWWTKGILAAAVTSSKCTLGDAGRPPAGGVAGEPPLRPRRLAARSTKQEAMIAACFLTATRPPAVAGRPLQAPHRVPRDEF